MLEINKHSKAEDDLLEIWLYTYAEWNEKQADHYLDALATSIERLKNHPKLGRECSHVRSGYRRLNALHHRIYYYPTDSSIEIVRVLHERTDEDYQFDNE